MIFAEPIYLYLLPVGLVLGVMLFVYSWKMRRRYLSKVVALRLQGRLTETLSIRRRRFKSILLILAIGLLFITLARPQFGHTWEEQVAKGIDILFILDTSNSMLAEDVRPNRLQRSKFAILDLLGKLEGDRVGLLAFAGGRFCSVH